MNEQLLREVVAQIEQHPERWGQRQWFDFRSREQPTACGTRFCIAGWTAVLTKGEQWWKDQFTVDSRGNWYSKSGDLGDEICDIATEALDISDSEADILFGAYFADDIDELKDRLYEMFGITFPDPAPAV